MSKSKGKLANLFGNKLKVVVLATLLVAALLLLVWQLFSGKPTIEKISFSQLQTELNNNQGSIDRLEIGPQGTEILIYSQGDKPNRPSRKAYLKDPNLPLGDQGINLDKVDISFKESKSLGGDF